MKIYSLCHNHCNQWEMIYRTDMLMAEGMHLYNALMDECDWVKR